MVGPLVIWMWKAHVTFNRTALILTGGEADTHARTLVAVERANERVLQALPSMRSSRICIVIEKSDPSLLTSRGGAGCRLFHFLYTNAQYSYSAHQILPCNAL